MKNLTLLFAGCIILFSCTPNASESSSNAKNGGFTITGTIEGAESMLVVIQANINGEWIAIDSSVVKNEQFVLNGKVESPQMQFIHFGKIRKFIGVFVENGDIAIEGSIDSLDNVIVKGSQIHDKYQAYSKGLLPYRDKLRLLYPKYDTADSLGDKSMEEDLDIEYESIHNEQIEYTKELISKNKNNALGPYLAGNIYFNDDKTEEAEEMISSFTEEAI